MNIRSNQNKLVVGIGAAALIFLILAFNTMPSVKYAWNLMYYRWFYGDGKIAGQSITEVKANWHRQEHALSCEVTALKIALSVFGLDVAESELIAKLSFDPTPKTKGVWGDPYRGFVGNIDGKMLKDGYGVYWDPIAAVANEYQEAKVIQGSLQDLTSHIKAGHPVIVWGYFGRGRKSSWLTPEGKRINAVNGEHARVVTGFMGTVDSPTGFILLDPIFGKLYWSSQELLKNWEAFERMAVVVYPNSRVLSVQN